MAATEFIPDLGKSARAAINLGGYAFHQRAIREGEAAFGDAKCESDKRWRLEAVEFPVQVRGRDTRIDILFRYNMRAEYLCVECKRANPALARWLFLRMPMVSRDRPEFERIQTDCVQAIGQRKVEPYDTMLDLVPMYGRTVDDRAVHLGIVMKTNDKGDDNGRGNRDDIEGAATQAHLAANGLLERWLGEAASSMQAGIFHSAIPAVFTTAKLVLGKIDVSSITDLESGKLDAGEIPGEEVPWVFLQSPVSLGIRARGAPQSYGSDIALAMDREMIRTVPIVTASGIREFLGTFDPGLNEAIPESRGYPFSRALSRQ